MHNPIIEMAECAASMLLEQIERGGPGEPMRVVYPARLVRRESA
jgi:DNA-binding LacI/PurR family transcriptional regulator